MTLPLLLSVYYRYYYRSGPSTGYRNIRTSEDIRRSTAPVRSTSLWWWNLWDGIPPLDLWDGIPPAISSRRVTAALGRPQKFHRKVPGADPSGIPAGIRR